MLKEATRPAWTLTEFEKPLVTATYFGFTPVSAPKITDADLEIVRSCTEHPYFDAAEKAALVRHYLENSFSSLPAPLAIAYKKAPHKKRVSEPGYSLHFIGASTGIAEAALIRAALSILSEEGYRDLRIDINCIGDKESIGTYERELINYVKKYGSNLPDNLKQSLKQDIWNLFRHEEEQMIELRANAPTSISYLSSQSRLHFKEVLEYIESLAVDFRIAPEVVGEKHHSSQSVFVIKGIGRNSSPESGESTLAVGYRYSRIGRRFGLRKEIPMAGVTIFSKSTAEAPQRTYKQLPKPKFYLVQLGREAKMKTLSLIENLRSHKIPVHHFLGKDKLTAQLTGAEELKVSYLIIIGHKEALDGTATIRNVSTRAQDTIPLSSLPEYLKNIAL